MTKYNHAYTIAFQLVSEHKEGEDVTADMLRKALLARIEAMDSDGEHQWHACVGTPFDTFVEED